MKKMVTLALMLVMMLSFSMTAYAAKDPVYSPSGKPTEEKNPTVVPPSPEVASPKTGENEIMLYGFGAAAVILASGAVVVRKKAMYV